METKTKEMKKLLIISGCFLLAGIYSCDDKKKKESDTGTGFTGDTVSVKTLSSAEAKAMIQHYKSDMVAANRGKLFRGGVKVSRLDSILAGATSFNVFAAAYLNNYSDSAKRNMPTFVLQVKRANSEEVTVYYSVDSDRLCPPPPDCNTSIESAEE